MVLPKKLERSRKPTEKAELLQQQHMAPDGTKKLGKPPVVLGKRKIRTPLGKGRVSPSDSKPESRRDISRARKPKPARPAAKRVKKDAPAKAKKRQSTPQRGKAARAASETEESASESSSMQDSEDEGLEAMDSLGSSERDDDEEEEEEEEGSRESPEAQDGQRSASASASVEPQVVSDSGADEPDPEPEPEARAQPGNAPPANPVPVDPRPAPIAVSQPPAVPVLAAIATAPAQAAVPAPVPAPPKSVNAGVGVQPAAQRPLSWPVPFGVPAYISPPTAQASAAASSSNSPAKLALMSTPFQPFLGQPGGASGSPMRRAGLTPTPSSLLAARGREPSVPPTQIVLAPRPASPLVAAPPQGASMAPQAPAALSGTLPAGRRPEVGPGPASLRALGAAAKPEPASTAVPRGAAMGAPSASQHQLPGMPLPQRAHAVAAEPASGSASLGTGPVAPAGTGRGAAAGTDSPRAPVPPSQPIDAQAPRNLPAPASSGPAAAAALPLHTKFPMAGPTEPAVKFDSLPPAAPPLAASLAAGEAFTPALADAPSANEISQQEPIALPGLGEAEPIAIDGDDRSPQLRMIVSPEEAAALEAALGLASAPAVDEPMADADPTAEPSAAAEPEPDPVRDEAARERRVRRRTEYEKERRWGLKVLLAEISAKAESLAQEVGVVRQQWSIDSLPEDARELPASERRRLQSSHQKRMQEILSKHCLTVARSVMNHKWAYPFNHPVDILQYKDYPTVVKTPMDLTTIRRKLENEMYRTPEEMAEDMRLVFSNAKLYNPPGSDVYVMATTVQEKFEEKWLTHIVGKLNDEDATRVAEEAAAVRRRLEQAQAKVIESMDGQRQSLIRQIESLESWIADAKSRAAAACLPLTSEEKDALVEAIANIDYGHREAIGTIVRSRYPELQDGEVMTVPLDCLDALTLRQLQHYARSAKRANQAGGEEAVGGDGGSASLWGKVGGSPQSVLPGAILGAGLRDPSVGRSLKRTLSGPGVESNRSPGEPGIGTPNAAGLGGLGRSRLSRPPLPPSKMAPRFSPYPPGIQPPATQASTALDRQQSSAAPGAGLTGAPQTLPTQGSWVGPGALLEAGSTEPPEAPQNELDRSASSIVVSELPSLGAWALNISQAMSAQAAAARPAAPAPAPPQVAQHVGPVPMEVEAAPSAPQDAPATDGPQRPSPSLEAIPEESGVESSEGKAASGLAPAA